MNKEIKTRLVCFLIGAFLISGGYFLSGEWRNEYVGDSGGFYPGEPVFEFDVRKSVCEDGWCNMAISSNIVLGLVGIMIGMASIAPMRLTNDIKEVEDE